MELKHKTCCTNTHAGQLLIVPYGIETLYKVTAVALANSFNRTLWN